MGFEWGDLNPLSWPGKAAESMGMGPGDRPVLGAMPNNDLIMRQINRGLGRNGAPAPQLAGGPQDQFRQGQVQQMGQLQGIASGQQKGAGELAIDRQISNAMAGQQAAARMSRGNALGARNASRQSAALGITGAGLGQQAAMGDQMQAQGMLSGVMNQGRGADINMAGQNASLQMNQNQLNEQTRLAYLSQLTGLSIAQLQAQAGLDAAWAAKPSGTSQLMQAAGAAGGAAAMSDERVKKDISDGDTDIDDMLDALRPKRYTYKDEARHGKGSRVGIIAQDMERSRAGRDVVREVADGKALDINAALSASLASVARLNARLRKVEARR